MAAISVPLLTSNGEHQSQSETVMCDGDQSDMSSKSANVTDMVDDVKPSLTILGAASLSLEEQIEFIVKKKALLRPSKLRDKSNVNFFYLFCFC